MADTMKKIIKANPKKSKGGKFTEAGREMEKLQTDMLLEYNTKYAMLGALAGPDKVILDIVTGTPFWSDEKEAQKLVDQFKNSLVKKFSATMEANGYIPDREGASAAPQGAPAPNVNPKTGRRILR
jgi:hypothetical protein